MARFRQTQQRCLRIAFLRREGTTNRCLQRTRTQTKNIMKNNVLYSWKKYSLSDYMDCLNAEGVGGYKWGIAYDQTESPTFQGEMDQADVDKYHLVTFTCLNSSDYRSYMIGEDDGKLTNYCC